MNILEIGYMNFRNLEDNNIKVGNKINVFYGKNGQGKTSFLEAIYFGARGFSFRTKKAQEIIKHSKIFKGCYLKYVDKISDKTLSVKSSFGKKEFKFNSKKITHNDFYGKINVISYIPEDIILISGAPQIRRNFFDIEISQANPEYFNDLKNFNKLLKIRNKYLKERNVKSQEFSIYQDEFIKYSTKVIIKRIEYIKKISIILNLNYRKLFDQKKELSLSYKCFLGQVSKLNEVEIVELIKEKIKDNFEKELKYGFSLVGPQKDDYIFFLNGNEAKITASQGEKKSIIFSLKLAEIEMIVKEKKENPILIIDDVTSYFDSDRQKNVLTFLEKKEIQVFISSVDKLDINSKNFYVEKGVIIESEN